MHKHLSPGHCSLATPIQKDAFDLAPLSHNGDAGISSSEEA